MNIRILTLILLWIPIGLFAQKKQQPKVLVYGSDITAFTAAVQSAKSNVPTVWVLDSEKKLAELTSMPLQITANKSLDGGIWLDLLMQIGNSKVKSDSLANAIKHDLNPQLLANAVETIETQLTYLTILKGADIVKASKGRRNWQVLLSNRQRFNVISIVDASADSKVSKIAQSSIVEASGSFNKATDLSLPLSRTTLAAAEIDHEIHVLLLKDLLDAEKDNLFQLGKLQNLAPIADNIPFKAAYGQALGATAAYLAFFKTNSKNINIRKLQAELMAFNARLMPYQDIKVTDPHYTSIQKCYLTGYFKGKVENGQYQFDKNGNLQFDDIKEVMNDIYTRSQLWFLDNYKTGDLTWRDLFGLIKYVSLKGDEVQTQIEKDWSAKRKFEGEFNLDNKVTRGQFAVMTDLYSTSFSKTINLDGSFAK